MKAPRIERSGTRALALGALFAGAMGVVLTCAKDPEKQPNYITGEGGLSGIACASGSLLQAPPIAGATGDEGSAGGGGVGGAAGAGGVGGVGGAAMTGPIVPVGPTPWLHVEGNQIKDPAGHTVILRGVDFPDLGQVQFGEGGINAMIDRVTNPTEPAGSCSPGWATRVIRLAISPADGEATTPKQYAPNSDYYDAILRPTVDYARAKGLYVIIDWHYIDDTTIRQATTTQFWTDIAPRLANDQNVLFELFNEPKNGGSWATVKPDMQAWHDIVRQAAPKNLILIGSANWDQTIGAAVADPIVGHDLVYVAHMYPLHWKNIAFRQQIGDAAKKVPVAITEWGFDPNAGDTLGGTVDSYGAPFKDFVRQIGASWTAWCASRSWQPTMFNSDLSLRAKPGDMGGFVKDWLYEDRLLNQPSGP